MPFNTRVSGLIFASAAVACTLTMPATAIAQVSAPVIDDSPTYLEDGMIELHVGKVLSKESVVEWISSRSRSVLADLGVTPPGEGAAPWNIRIYLEGYPQKYRVAVAAARGTATFGSTDMTLCSCDADQLLASIEAQLRTLIAELRLASHEDEAPADRPSPPPPVVASTSVVPPPSDTQPSAVQARSPKVRAMTTVGAVVGTAGLAPFLYGLVMTLRPVEEERTSQGADIRNYATPASYANLGLGVAAVATGLVLVIVDQTHCKKRSRGCRGPKAIEHGWGISPALRF